VRDIEVQFWRGMISSAFVHYHEARIIKTTKTEQKTRRLVPYVLHEMKSYLTMLLALRLHSVDDRMIVNVEQMVK
jgi:hypothetical protein